MLINLSESSSSVYCEYTITTSLLPFMLTLIPNTAGLPDARWNNHYLQNINKAVSNYKDCNNRKCGCYKRVIDNDLKPWRLRKGITKESFDKAANQGDHRGAEKGTHYQIINHKVYRHNRCTFPARFVYDLMFKL